MDGLTFISEIIKALAWPTTIIVLVYLLKKPDGYTINLSGDWIGES